MSDAINGACRAMAEAASALRDVVNNGASSVDPAMLAENLEKALADLRLMASGDERFK